MMFELWENPIRRRGGGKSIIREVTMEVHKETYISRILATKQAKEFVALYVETITGRKIVVRRLEHTLSVGKWVTR